MLVDAGAPTQATLGAFTLTGPPLAGDPQAHAARWRRAVLSCFPDVEAFRGPSTARSHARYPELHYRWLDATPALFAVGDAVERVMAHPWLGAALRFGDEERRVADVVWSTFATTCSFAPRLVRYRFCSPWLALNQQNHARFRSMDYGARRAELDRILVGNLLTMCQSFGWHFREGETVYAAFELAREVPCVVRDVAMAGFEGTFVCNLVLSDEIALGRSVSLGFGWIRRIEV